MEISNRGNGNNLTNTNGQKTLQINNSEDFVNDSEDYVSKSGTIAGSRQDSALMSSELGDSVHNINQIQLSNAPKRLDNKVNQDML